MSRHQSIIPKQKSPTFWAGLSVLLASARLPGTASNLDGAFKLTVSDSSNISHSVTVATTTVVEGTAAHLSGKTLNGTGTVNVLALDATLGALLDNITTNTVNIRGCLIGRQKTAGGYIWKYKSML